jgi:hypothetical protein
MKKDSVTSEEMCEGLENFQQLWKFYDAVRSIGYDEEPDYDFLWDL